MSEKRKKEIKKALKNGQTVLFYKCILNSPNYEKPEKVTKIWGKNIHTEQDVYHFVDGDYFQIKK